MPSKEGTLTRDQMAANLVLNYSMIMMGVFEGVFAALSSKMSEVMVAGATAMSETLASGTPADKGKSRRDASKDQKGKVELQVSEGVKKMFSDIRSEMAAKMSAGDESFRRYLKNPGFDEGIRIVESYDFGLPKLTGQLEDEDIAAYLTMVGKEDAKLGKMLRELSAWQDKMPKLQKDEQ